MKRKSIILTAGLVLTLVLCALFISGCRNTDTDKAGAQQNQTGEEEEVISLAIFSDVHYGQPIPSNGDEGVELSDPEGKLRKALETYYKMAPELDAICVAGDLTDNGKDAEYQAVTELIQSYIQKNKADTKVLYTMGNHEFYAKGWGYGVGNLGEGSLFQSQFEKMTGSPATAELVVGGVHILGFSPDDEMDAFAPREEWLMERIKAAAQEDPSKPIILIGHKAIENTVVGSSPATKTYTDPVTKQKYEKRTGNCADWSQEFLDFLKDYPQTLYFSGHTHHLISDPLSIHQDYITSLQCGTLGSTTGFRDTSGFYQRYGRSMGYLVTIDSKNVVTINKMNFTDDTTYGEPYVLDIPKIVEDSASSFQFTDKRFEESKPPVFDSAAKLEVECQDESVRVKWPEAKLAEDDQVSNFILMYKVKIFDYKKNQYVYDYDAPVKSDYFAHYTPYYSAEIGDTCEEFLEDILYKGRQYRAEVIAITHYNVESEPLTVDFNC